MSTLCKVKPSLTWTWVPELLWDVAVMGLHIVGWFPPTVHG